MRTYIFAILMAATALTLASCDDGPIEVKTVATKEGKVVKMQGRLTGLDNWSGDFHVALAGFDGTDDYAVISKVITKTDDNDGNVTIVMSGIGNEVTNVQLCVIDRLRRHVMTFNEEEVPAGTRDTIAMNVGTVDVSMLNAIQQGYLNTTCANCHGASNRAAADLFLTEGRTYGSTVGIPSLRVADRLIVEPGNAEGSVLHMVLNQESVSGISMNHRDLVSEKNEQAILPLIDSWINQGAIEH